MKEWLHEKYLGFVKKSKKHADVHSALFLVPAVVLVGFTSWLVPTSDRDDHVVQKDDAVIDGLAFGNIMTGRHIPQLAEEKDGYLPLFDDISAQMQSSDYVTGNIKGPLLSSSPEDMETFARPDRQPEAGEEAFADDLKELSFTHLHIGNHRTMDYMEEGLEETIANVSERDMAYTGAGLDNDDAFNIRYDDINGKTVATLGFSQVHLSGTMSTPYTPGIAHTDTLRMVSNILEAERNADLVMVHVHWGDALQDKPTPEQREFAEALSQAGADYILGHHPYALQPIERINDTTVFYSMGNFVFDTGFSTHRDSMMMQFFMDEDDNLDTRVEPLFLHEGQPTRFSESDDSHRKNRIISTLTRELDEEEYHIEDGSIWLHH